MLELDKSGNWWLDGRIIESWEITEKWTKIVNSAESMSDKIEVMEVKLATQDQKIGNFKAALDIEREVVKELRLLLKEASAFARRVSFLGYKPKKGRPVASTPLCKRADIFLDNPVIKDILQELGSL